jgi:hypothetical protein
MRYLLLIYGQELQEAPPDDVAAASHAAYAAFTADVKARGMFEAGEALTPTSTATTVRVVNGETVTTDGPFAETKEWLGGYYKIDVDSLDEAIEWAGRVPSLAQGGSIEVRPVAPMPTGQPSST